MLARFDDYAVGKDNDLTDEEIVNFALFADCNNPKLISKFREAMISQFEMTDLGLMSYFLGIVVHQLDGGIFISQRKYASDILKKFKMDVAKPMMTLVEEILKLTKDGTGDFVDATYFRTLVVALSTAEEKYMAATSSATQALWLRRMLGFLQHKQDGPTKIFCDSLSAIELTKNSIFHGRSKHIDIKYHFIREFVQQQKIVIDYCRSEDQVADILIKLLKLERFMKLKKMLSMVKFEELSLREAMNIQYVTTDKRCHETANMGRDSMTLLYLLIEKPELQSIGCSLSSI
ncbi:uncharacterized protein LOC113767079 [Coffea eugenioides]|uniref:uncharacterized protein LOC113767079 n=1 Tax=Coffea eugenioides TaxID=49369 RepID=UPI000F60CE79|nr:uncharacterized protein LOC113767079 [Coffea eugenioides]